MSGPKSAASIARLHLNCPNPVQRRGCDRSFEMHTVVQSAGVEGSSMDSYWPQVEWVNMRLHIWPVGSAVKVGSLLPHTHSSHLWSFVLLGGIENLVWVPAEGDDSHRLSAASIVHRRGGRSSVAEGEVSLRLADRSEHSTGSCYFVPQGTFHASCTPPRTFCATVVLRGAKTHTAVVAGLSDLGRHPDRLETRLTDFERSLLNEIDWMLLHKGQRGAFDENDREAELSASVTRRTERPVP